MGNDLHFENDGKCKLVTDTKPQEEQFSQAFIPHISIGTMYTILPV